MLTISRDGVPKDLPLASRQQDDNLLCSWPWHSYFWPDCMTDIVLGRIVTRHRMSMMLLQLSVFIVAVIQLTSSQPTVTSYQRENDDGSCYARNEARLRQMQDSISQLVTAVTQLQTDVTEQKKEKPAKNAKGYSSMSHLALIVTNTI